MQARKAGEERGRLNMKNKLQNYAVYIITVSASSREWMQGLTVKSLDKRTEYEAPKGKTECNCILLGNVV